MNRSIKDEKKYGGGGGGGRGIFTSIALVYALKVITGRNFMNCDSEHCATFYGAVRIFVFQTQTLKTKKAEKGPSRSFFFKLSSPQSRFHRLLTIYTYTRTVLFIKRGRCFIYLYKYKHNPANSTVKKYICIDADRSFKTCLD